MSKAKLDSFRPQSRNANRHTQRGMGLLEKSIQQDGWIGAITVAADGETFDGSARIEVGAATGFEDAIVVESDGTRPIVHVRKDIPSADDPRAKRLGVAANRIASLNLDWDIDELLASVAEGVDLSAMFREDELDALLQAAHGQGEAGKGEDKGAQVDRAAELAQAWGTKLGQVWELGAHRLAVGDCTDRATVEAVMRGERAAICFTSPPYNAGKTPTEDKMGVNSKYVGNSDDLSQGEYLSLLGGFTSAAFPFCGFVFVNIQMLAGNKFAFIDYLYAYKQHLAEIIIWDKQRAQPAMAENVTNSQFEFVLVLSPKSEASRAIGTAKFRGTVSNVYSGPPQTNNDMSGLHSATFPLHLPTWAVETFTNRGEGVYEPFAGTGTTLIACEKLNRKCRAIELDEGYAAVSIQRWHDMTGKEPRLIT